MPTISYFFGIRIKMYWQDHPPPHFHAFYQGLEAQVAIADGRVIAGRLPRTARQIVRDWAAERRLELTENWERARRLEPLEHIAGPGDDDDEQN